MYLWLKPSLNVDFNYGNSLNTMSKSFRYITENEQKVTALHVEFLLL